MKLISRKDAKAQGLKWYFTGKPCPKGHISKRAVNGGCYACNKLLNAANAPIYYKKNKAKIKKRVHGRYVAKPEAVKAQIKGWRRANPLAARAIAQGVKARRAGAKGRYTKLDIEALLIKQRNTCLCGVSFDFEPYTVDHIVATARGGSNYPENLQLLCSPCNVNKGVLSMDEWLPRWAASLEAIGELV